MCHLDIACLKPSPRLAFLLAGISLSLLSAGCTVRGPAPALLGDDPLNTVYRIDEVAVPLSEGEASRQAAPGSATRVETRVFGPTVQHDLDGDGDEDTLLWLTHAPGGSGTFYYVAAALREAHGYRGSTAVLIGDRIAPQNLAVHNGLVMANYADRAPGQAMAVPPSVGRTAYLIWRNDALTLIPPPPTGEQMLQGWLVIGHEVREFRPCPSRAPLWLLGNSPALAELQTAYQSVLPDAPPYTQLFVTLTGRVTEQPRTGFGASYEGGFAASRLVNAVRQGSCTVANDQ